MSNMLGWNVSKDSWGYMDVDDTPVPPSISDALFWLDGEIIYDSGSYYFKDKSGNNRNFLITGYDFDTDWTGGMPYKTASTISAPAADATLIAEDVNNYLYDSGGTPNQIPTVSLFQNIDYADKLFCRHKAQKLDSNGVETYQPRVVDIVLYNSVKTGDTLTACNSFFGVPVKLTSNIIDVGVGKTYTTINTAITAAVDGDTIYIHTGVYTEDINSAKQLSLIGLGYVKIRPTPAQTYAFRWSGINSVFKGIHFVNNTATNGFRTTNGPITFERCYFDYFSTTYSLWLRGLIGQTVKDCILKGLIQYTAFNGVLDIIGNYITTQYPAFDYLIKINTPPVGMPTVGSVFTAKYNKTNTETIDSTSSTVAMGFAFADSINIFNNYGKFNDITAIFGSGNLLGDYKVRYNRIIAQKSTDVNNGFLRNTYANIVENNYVEIKTGQCMLLSFINRTGVYDLIIRNNNFKPFINSDIALKQINAVEYSIYFENNYLESREGTNGEFMVSAGLETPSADKEYNLYIRGNRIRGSKDFGFAQGNHCAIMVWQIKNFDISHNYFSGSEVGQIVLKSNTITSTVAINGIVKYNLLEGFTGLLLKGLSNAKIYDNTILTNEGISPPIWFVVSEVATTSNDCEIKNNIIVNEVEEKMIILEGTNNILENNVYYPNGVAEFTDNSVDYDFAGWQAHGKDTDSIIQNPNLNASLIPSTPIAIGEDLGVDYNDGLDISTNWGSSIRVPIVVTKQQTGNWQVGAYIQ